MATLTSNAKGRTVAAGIAANSVACTNAGVTAPHVSVSVIEFGATFADAAVFVDANVNVWIED